MRRSLCSSRRNCRRRRVHKPIERYARFVEMKQIVANDYNLNISRYVSTAQEEEEIDLTATHRKLVAIEASLQMATARHNEFLKERLVLQSHLVTFWGDE